MAAIVTLTITIIPAVYAKAESNAFRGRCPMFGMFVIFYIYKLFTVF